MSTIIFIIQILAIVSGCVVALMSIILFIQLHWPAPALWFLKLYASALSQVFTFLGLLIAIIGLATGSDFIGLLGVYSALVFGMHLFRVSRPPEFLYGFEHAFGVQWKSRIPVERKKYFMPSRIILKLPSTPEPRLEQNISFSTVPNTDRKLLCDVWQPHSTIPHSGLAFIFLHGSAFYFLDKDCGTRPFFRHLTAQGHVIMDVAYRLAPETDMMGMVHDVKRAIHWMKENASKYGVDPHRIVLGGGSAGAHLALLTAYTNNDPPFTPNELKGTGLSVCAVISLYGPDDLEAHYYHTNQHLTTRSTPGRPPTKKGPSKIPDWMIKRMGEDYHRLGFDKDFKTAGSLAPLMGGHPDECPETYALFSPNKHVHPHCPPTLLIHGEHDLMAPIKTTRLLHQRLLEEGVRSVLHIFPQTDHAFDLVLPQISPSAHSAFYDVERFLALQLELKL